MSFFELHERVLRLRNDPIDDDDASDQLDHIEVRAIQVYQQYAAQGRPGFSAEHCAISDGATGFKREKLLRIRWEGLATLYNGGPYSKSAGGWKYDGPIKHLSNSKNFAVTLSRDPKRWRSRAEYDAAALAVLAELAGETTGKGNKPPKKPKIEINEKRGQVRVRRKWHEVSDGQLDIIKALHVADGAWVSGKALRNAPRSRPDRIIRAMPKGLRAVIQSHQTKGYRLRPDILGAQKART